MALGGKGTFCPHRSGCVSGNAVNGCLMRPRTRYRVVIIRCAAQKGDTPHHYRATDHLPPIPPLVTGTTVHNPADRHTVTPSVPKSRSGTLRSYRGKMRTV